MDFLSDWGEGWSVTGGEWWSVTGGRVVVCDWGERGGVVTGGRVHSGESGGL